MHDELLLLQRGQSVQHKRAVQQRFAVAKESLWPSSSLRLLLTALPFLKGSEDADTSPKPEAVRLYELGQCFYNQVDPGRSHRRRWSHLSQAVELDPKICAALSAS